MLSYAALIIGSLLSVSVLFINNNKSLQIRSSSTGIGGFKISNNYPLIDSVEPIEFSHSEELDTLSYRSILVGFVLLTLGLISGAVGLMRLGVHGGVGIQKKHGHLSHGCFMPLICI